MSQRYSTALPSFLLVGLLWLAATVTSAKVGINPDTLLTPDQAFQFSAREVGADMVRAEWRIAEGYHLYRDRIHFRSDNPAVSLADPVLPPPTETVDEEGLGLMAIYRGTVAVDIPVRRDRSSTPLKFTLIANSQGCVDAGLCFPPHDQKASLQLAAVSAPFQTDQGESGKSLLSTLGDRLGFKSKKQEFLEPDQAFMYLADAAGPDHLTAQWEIAPGYYLYRDKIQFTLRDAKGIVLGEYALPRGVSKTDENFGKSEVFYDELAVSLPLQRTADAVRSFTLETRYQGCADAGLCYPPITKTTLLTLPDAPIAPSITSPITPFISEQDRLTQSLMTGNRPLTLLAFFGAGILLAFTPCMFPMIPILSSLIVGQGTQVTTRRAFRLSLSYVLAMAVTYTIAGVIAGLFGANLQAAFQNPWIIGAFSALFVILALSMFGFYNLQIPTSWQTRISVLSNKQPGGTMMGAGIMGFLSALIVGPCMAAPLAGALIYIGRTGDALLGGASLFSLSLGMGLPLLAIGSSAGKWLPKAGGWMNTVKSIFGVLLLALAVWMLDRIVPPQVTLGLWGVLLIISAIYLGAFDRLLPDVGGWYRLWKGLGLVLVIYGGILIIGAASGGSNPLRPLQAWIGTPDAPGNQHLQFASIKGVSGLEQALQSAGGRPVLLDFYADWCVSCKEMERDTFSHAGVQQALAGAVLLRTDVTANDSEDQALLKRFDILGPPSIMFFGADGLERKTYRVVGFKGPEEFARIVTLAFESPSP